MPKEFSRKLRVEELIQREIAILLQQEVKDPRIGMVTVSSVDISPDLKHAKVFVTLLSNEKDRNTSITALNHAAQYLRHELARRIYLKSIPAIRFVYDESIARGVRLTELINNAVAGENKAKEIDS